MRGWRRLPSSRAAELLDSLSKGLGNTVRGAGTVPNPDQVERIVRALGAANASTGPVRYAWTARNVGAFVAHTFRFRPLPPEEFAYLMEALFAG
jgi:hypothetical protein